jgi:hypothetical protein
MAKFSGVIGYGESQEVGDTSVWKDVITERKARGEVGRNSRNLKEGDKVNNDLSVGNSITIVANAYASKHFFAIRYVVWAGTRWIVTKVDEESPRLILRLGGVYHGPTP